MPNAIRLSGSLADIDRILRGTEPVFWGVFLFAASGGFAFIIGPGEGERLFWLAADLLAVTFVSLSLGRYADRILHNWHLFSWPALAALSTLWSLAPRLSFYHALQLFLTLLVGLVMRERFGLDGTVRILFFALGGAMLLSIALCASGVASTMSAQGEWQGVYHHKNELGTYMVVLFFVSLTLAANGWHRGVAIAFAAGSAVVLLKSGSAGALVVFAIVACAAAFLFALRAGLRAAMLSAGLVMAATAIIALYLASFSESPIDLALDVLDKDRTLTGRTTLWDFGRQSFSEQPVLGLGYKAYWESTATSSTFLRYFIGQDLWFFHNNFLEVAVALGIIGLAAFTIGIVVAVSIAMGRFVNAPSPINIWAVLIIVHILVAAAVENPLFVNHSLFQVLFTIVGVRLARRERFNE